MKLDWIRSDAPTDDTPNGAFPREFSPVSRTRPTCFDTFQKWPELHMQEGTQLLSFQGRCLETYFAKNAIGSQMQLVYFSALFQKMHEKLLFNMSLYIPIQPQILAWGRRLQTCECTRSSYYCQYVHSCSPELGSCRLYRSWASPIPVTKA